MRPYMRGSLSVYSDRTQGFVPRGQVVDLLEELRQFVFCQKDLSVIHVGQQRPQGLRGDPDQDQSGIDRLLVRISMASSG